MTKILIVDDEKDICEILELYLTNDFAVESTDDPLAALKKAKEAPYDVIITDISMHSMQGDVLVREILKILPECVIFLMSGADIESDELERIDGKIAGVFSKPFVEPEKMIQMIKNALEAV